MKVFFKGLYNEFKIFKKYCEVSKIFVGPKWWFIWNILNFGCAIEL